MSLFIEGFETSSTVLSFTLFELARSPECQERLHNEIVEVEARHKNIYTYEALQDMTYLDCVVMGNNELKKKTRFHRTKNKYMFN